MNLSPCLLDHLAVAATTLESGADFVEQVLGVRPQAGGEHASMGTHNLLLRLGDATYLEVIAIRPGAPPPGRPRWFGLDRLESDSAPCLRTWIARCDDIHATARAAGEDLGEITPMRRGDLQWQMTIPETGKPPLGGVAPALIEWKKGQPHPADKLQDHGLQLECLELFHPRPYRVMGLLQAISCDDRIRVRRSAPGHGAALVAHIRTPQGLRVLAKAG